MLCAAIVLSQCQTWPWSTSSSTAHAADDTFACLDTFNGPIIRLAGEQGYQSVEYTDVAPETRFDARGASWKAYLSVAEGYRAVRNCYAVELGDDWRGCFRQTPARFDLWDRSENPRHPAPPVCWAGGLIEGTQSKDLQWRQVKLSQGMAITINSQHGVVDGVRIHNHQDAFVPLISQRFELRNSWITNNRDDAVENDGFASGVIEDNLIDATFVFLSMRNTGPIDPPVAAGPSGLVEITNNIVRMGPRSNSGELLPYWKLFKFGDQHAPSLSIHRNFFAFPAGKRAEIDPSPAKIVSCSDNLVLYEGNQKPKVPLASCFDFTHDVSLYERAVQNWINCHPEVMRLPSDVEPSSAACDQNFWGGRGEGQQAR